VMSGEGGAKGETPGGPGGRKKKRSPARGRAEIRKKGTEGGSKRPSSPWKGDVSLTDPPPKKKKTKFDPFFSGRFHHSGKGSHPLLSALDVGRAFVEKKRECKTFLQGSFNVLPCPGLDSISSPAARISRLSHEPVPPDC